MPKHYQGGAGDQLSGGQILSDPAILRQIVIVKGGDLNDKIYDSEGSPL